MNNIQKIIRRLSPPLIISALILLVSNWLFAGSEKEPASLEVQGSVELATMLVGRFAGTSSDSEIYLEDQRTLMAPLGEGVWFYFRRDRDGILYRERVVQLIDQPDGSVRQQTWRLVAPEIPVADITLDSLQSDAMAGGEESNCLQVWRRTHSEQVGTLWQAIIDPDNCVIFSSRRNQAIRIGAETRLTQNRLLEAERGFTIENEFLWGTPVAEFSALQRME